jgi:O-antigen biosynthesis protein
MMFNNNAIIPGSVPGTIMGVTPNRGVSHQPEKLPPPPESQLPRGINFYADYSGCGYWRMLWPEQILTAYHKMVIHGSTVMCFDEGWYRDVKAIRVQRQATPGQLKFVKFLKDLSQKYGFRLIYEIDDIIFKEDIPDYNKFKAAFTDPVIRETAQEIMSLCDEVTVTCDFMKQYYLEKTPNKNITVIPNYMPRFWMGNFYDEKSLGRNFEKNRKKPRVLYPGSGAHFDVDNRVKQQDDFGHVVDHVIKTRKKFKWVFLGAFPLKVRPYIQSGEMEFIQWNHLYDYPYAISNIKANVLVAPLCDNVFNRAKSDLKYIEACAYGLPSVCQDIDTYANAPYRFTTGDEMIDQIDSVVKDKSTYMKISRKARGYAETRWLESEENIGKYYELYTTEYNSPDRKYINSVN